MDVLKQPVSAEIHPGEFVEPRRPRYETLTAWRGVACLWIVCFHFVFVGYGLAFPGGTQGIDWLLAIINRLWLGVPLFFVISGYCVTASADAARRSHGSARQFFWRRFRRIYPPYWAWFAITALVVFSVERVSPGFFQQIFIPDPKGLNLWQWLGNLSLTETWRWHITGGVETALIPPSWSLCYEEQFYALMGLGLVFARRHLFTFLIGISGMVLASMCFLPVLGLSAMGTFLDGKWLMFAAGILVYYVVNYAPPKLTLVFCLPLVLGLVCAAVPPRYLLIPRINEANQSFACAFAFALLLIWLHRFDDKTAKLPVLKPLNFCGEMCYSLYLVHWPTVTVVSWAFRKLGVTHPVLVLVFGISLGLVVAIGVARVFYHLVERRVLNSRAYNP